MPPATVDPRENVLQAGSIQARVAKVYAEALLAAALKQGDADAVESVGDELNDFVAGVLGKKPAVANFLASPAVGKKAKAAAFQAALPGNASDLLRGLFGVLARNMRLDLIPGIAEAYNQLLDERAGRVRVKVSAAAELTDAQKAALTDRLAAMLKRHPVLDVHVNPDLLGGMVVQVGDRVIDTSVRTRLETLRTLLLDKGSSYVVEAQR
jgi:F-type H+-transporting ATPase subunit delta